MQFGFPSWTGLAVSRLGLVSAAFLAGTLGATAAFAQVRISEVYANPPGADAGFQKAELTNYGESTVTIGGLRICVQFFYATIPGGAATTLDPGESYTIHVRTAGTNDDNNWYVPSPYPALVVADDSFALYKSAGAFTDPNAMLDFVQWGAGGQPRENVAVSAGLWPLGQFVPVPSEGMSIQLCDELSHAPAGWVAGNPTVGAPNACAAPKPMVVLNEVLVDPVGDNSGNQQIEIRNLEASPMDLSDWQICFQFLYWPLPAGTTLGAGEHLVVHLNASGVDDAFHKYTGPIGDLGPSDAFALYLPIADMAEFDDPAKIIDFVQWGASGQPRENVADAAGVWTAGDFLATPGVGHSLERCSPDFGMGSWGETPDQTLGSVNSCNPTGVAPGAPRVVHVGPPVPNPMWECSIVQFDLSAPAHVVARVRDVRGRIVNVLADQQFTAGPQVVVWEGDDRGHAAVGPGIYFVEFTSPDAVGPDGGPFHQAVRMVRARH